MTKTYEGEIKINEESKAAQFFYIDNLPKNISPPVIPTINELKKRYGKKDRSLVKNAF